MTETTYQHDHPLYQTCGSLCPDAMARRGEPAAEIDAVIAAQAAAEATYYAGENNTESSDTGFTMQLDDTAASQIEADGANASGFTLALGHLKGNGWGEVHLDWAAAQIVADELNALLRQARINSWS